MLIMLLLTGLLPQNYLLLNNRDNSMATTTTSPLLLLLLELNELTVGLSSSVEVISRLNNSDPGWQGRWNVKQCGEPTDASR